jgi:hypothetical protein
VSSIAFDPSDASGNHVFVGTTGGGLWQTQNAAAASGSVRFVPVTDGLAALSGASEPGVSIGAVTVQPGATGVVLAGLGDPNDALDSYYGGGLLRTADGGKTWTLITQTMDLEDGLGVQDFSFLGLGFAGFAWSTANVQMVVAAVSEAYEGTLVNAQIPGQSMEGLYYSNDGGATWHLSQINDANGQTVQGPENTETGGNAATAVVWNPVRGMFVAAVRYHGYYQSPDGVTWTQMAAQPGPGFTALNCPTNPNGPGSPSCPIFRGSLAVNPMTGDTFAWSVDINNQDQGLWQDACGISSGACTNQTVTFATQLNTAALESSTDGGDLTIANGDYNLTLAAIPSQQDTLLFAGDDDLWQCSLANSCQWRNTTNTTTCMSAQVGEYQHALAWSSGNPLLFLLGNDSGLWRSTDDAAETGPVCSASDATHFQNLNASLGPLAEVDSLAVSAASASTLLTGLGANGFAGIVHDPASSTVPPGDWNQVLGGEGGTVAINPSSQVNDWYANNEAGVSIFHCDSTTLCTPAAFGTAPAIGETQVGGDGLVMESPAAFELDPLNTSNVLIATCRVWQGPANGAGWTASNAISPALDGTGGPACESNALIRSLAAQPVAGGGENIYAGMTGVLDGGGIVAGHVFGGTVQANGSAGPWSDLALAPVTNSSLPFNPWGQDVSSLYADPHDSSANTVYATISGFSTEAEPMQQVYRTVDGGAHWLAITSNLPNSPANAIVVDPNDANTVYVAMDAGVYVTRQIATCGEAGVADCWAAYGTNLPLAPATQLTATAASSSQVLTVGTYGRGVWQIPLATAGVTQTTASLTPTSLSFGPQTVGTVSAAQTITLKTTGTVALAVTGISFGGTAASDFAETDTCTGKQIAKNATCAVKVTFDPTATGSRGASMAIGANVAGGQILVPLSGTGLSTATITLLPAGLSFGNQQDGTTSAGQVVNVQNVGGTAVSISSVTVNSPFVRSGNTCGSTLTANTACAVTVAFAPTAPGPASGTLTVTDSAGTQTAPLSGTGVAGPTDTLSTTSLAFSPTVIGQTSAPLAAQITNSGGLPLTGIGTSVTGTNSADYAAISNCGGTLAAGESCTVSVTFSPTLAQAEYAALAISDALRSQTVKLSGTGVKPPLIKLSTGSLAFGNEQINVTSAPKTLTLTNAGGAPLANPSASISGLSASSFALGATTCTASLAPAASCTIAVTFTPIATGTAAAVLNVTSSSPGVLPGSAVLTGTGLSPPMIGVSPSQLNLGPVAVGGSSSLFSVQISNSGQEPLNPPVFSITGGNAAEFAWSRPSDVTACTAALNPGQSCYVQITFSPSSTGLQTATLTVTSSNAVPGTATVGLSGTGTPLFELKAEPGSLSFPATAVNTASAALSITLSNLGKLAVNGLTLTPSGPYALANSATTCKATLAAFAFCRIGVIFDPSSTGDQPGQLAVTVSNLGVAALDVPLDGTGLAVGTLSVSPTQMTFGSVVVHTASAPETLTVTNTGEAQIAGVSVTATGDFSVVSNQCAGALAAGASCTAGVVLTPSSTGNRQGSLTVSSASAGVAPATVGLTGTGIPPGSLSATPPVVTFGAVTIGGTSAAMTVTVNNNGANVVGGLQFLLGGDYGLSQNQCGTQLAGGASCTFQVSFSPSQPGTRIGSVTVTSTNTGFTPLVIGLTGTGLAAAELSVTPASLEFGAVPDGGVSAAQELTIANPGTGMLQGLTVMANAPFSVGSGSCGTTVAAGASCRTPITFAPQFAGSQSGQITVSSTTQGVASVQVMATGTGLAPGSLAIAPASLAFAPTSIHETSGSQTATVSNPGGSPLNGLTVTASGDFAIAANGCPGTLAGGAQCMVQVDFTPTVPGGRLGTLTAASTTQGVASASIALSGTGLTPAVLSVAPTQLTFAPVLTGQTSATQVVTVANSGASSIADLTLTLTQGFALDATRTTCTQALASGSSCKAGIAFAPVAAGQVSGSLSASSVSAAAPATVALSGTGASPPGIVVTPEAVVNFSTTGVGQAGTPVAVTVTNSGTISALTGLSLAVDATGASNGFGLSANTCATLPASGLAPGASCTANVTFAPTLAGRLTGNLLITSANGANAAHLELGGLGFDFGFLPVGNASATVVPGQTGYLTLAVTPVGAPSGVFTFACANLPANALCLFNPTEQQPLPPSVTGNIALGIATGAPASGSGNVAGNVAGNGLGQRRKAQAGAGLLVCAAALLPLACFRRRRSWRGRLPAVAMVAACGWALMSLTSCAGSGGSSNQIHYGGGTPPGSYPIRITATSTGVTHSCTVTLVVN